MEDFLVNDLLVSQTKGNALLDAQGSLQSLLCVVDVAIGATKIVGGQGKLAKREGKV